jgi:hypothetical protein
MRTRLIETVKKAAIGALLTAQMVIFRIAIAWAAEKDDSGGADNRAIDINTDYELSNKIGEMNPEALIIGLALWISRLIGTGMLIWGIYGYVTARKDGEAESMNGALGKLISGLVLICMPAVLQGLGVISG